MNPSERSLKMRLAAHKSWANTRDRSKRTEAARQASHHTRFLDQARRDNPDATEQQLQDIADSLKKAFYTELALKSAQARRVARQVQVKKQLQRNQVITPAPADDAA